MRFRARGGQRDNLQAKVEDPTVRQYRFLLRTAPSDAVEFAHVEALQRLSDHDRAAVLSGVQEGFDAGHRVSPDDHERVAHFVVTGENRNPGAFLAACPPAALLALASAVIHAEATFGLFSGYAAWDGAEPEPEDDSAWADAGFNPDSGRWNPQRRAHLDNSGVVDAGGGGGDGGGGG